MKYWIPSKAFTNTMTKRHPVAKQKAQTTQPTYRNHTKFNAPSEGKSTTGTRWGINDPDAGKSKGRSSYVKTPKKGSVTVGPLGYSQPTEQAICVTIPLHDIGTIVFHGNGVADMLRNSEPHKAIGPDHMPVRLTTEAVGQPTPSQTMIFQVAAP